MITAYKRTEQQTQSNACRRLAGGNVAATVASPARWYKNF